MFEVWDFVRRYRDFLHVPTSQVLSLNSFVFFNQIPPDQFKHASQNPYVNVYHILIRFLVMEEVKKLTTVRKSLRDPMWALNMYNVLYYTTYCDEYNFQSFIRGYFDSTAYQLCK